MKAKMEMIRGQKRILTCIILFSTIVVVIAMLLSFSAAQLAYHATPDVASFRHFAQPETRRFETKGSYLFSPVLLQVGGVFVAIGAFALRKRMGEEKLKQFFLWWAFWTLVCFVGEMFQASSALAAIGHSEPILVLAFKNLLTVF